MNSHQDGEKLQSLKSLEELMKVDFVIKAIGHWISWVISFIAQWMNSTK